MMDVTGGPWLLPVLGPGCSCVEEHLPSVHDAAGVTEGHWPPTPSPPYRVGSDSAGPGQLPRFCFSNTLSCATADAGLWTIL